MKFKTKEERQLLQKQYVWHCANGLSDECFIPCDPQTFKWYLKEFPLEFDTELITEARRGRQYFWESMGVAGSTGRLGGFNSSSWKYNMANRFNWREKRDVDVRDKTEMSDKDKENIMKEGLEDEVPPQATSIPATTQETPPPTQAT